MITLSKRISILFCAVIMLVCSTSVAFAESTQKLIDDAGLLTSSEQADIVQKMTGQSKETGWDFVVYTNYNGVSKEKMERYTNEYYDKHNFGIGDKKSGVLLNIDMGSRELYMITKGDAMYYFSDSRNDEILDDIQACMKSKNYNKAVNDFVDLSYKYYCQGILKGDSNNNVKINQKYDNPVVYSLLHYGIIAIIVGAVVGFVIALIINRKYKHNGKEGTYDLHQNSVTNLNVSNDTFITKSVSVRTIETSSSSSSSSGGGGGGGSSHGGGGRSF